MTSQGHQPLPLQIPPTRQPAPGGGGVRRCPRGQGQVGAVRAAPAIRPPAWRYAPAPHPGAHRAHGAGPARPNGNHSGPVAGGGRCESRKRRRHGGLVFHAIEAIKSITNAAGSTLPVCRAVPAPLHAPAPLLRCRAGPVCGCPPARGRTHPPRLRPNRWPRRPLIPFSLQDRQYTDSQQPDPAGALPAVFLQRRLPAALINPPPPSS